MTIPLPDRASAAATRRSPRERATPEVDLAATLRRRILGDLHLGRLRAGDRLPSIRALAREEGVDHRAVARAYRALEAEGLVEIRGRSGVRVRVPERAKEPENGLAPERVRWLARVIAESWSRRVPTRDLLRLLEARAAGAGLRCVCVESDRDDLAAYCAEIGDLSEMTMVPCLVAPGRGGKEERARLREQVRAADLVVTTAFHAATVREALGAEGPPHVVLRVDPEPAERPTLARETVEELTRVLVQVATRG